MDRRSLLKTIPSAAMLTSLGASPFARTAKVQPWWTDTNFVPTGPVYCGRVKICFEGMFPRKGETRIWSGIDRLSTLPGWRKVRIITRGNGLDLHSQDGRLWVTAEDPVARSHGGMHPCDLPALPHPDDIGAESQFAFRRDG